MNDPVYELVLFQLKPGFERERFMKVTTSANSWLQRQPGFLSREILEDESGQWIDLLRWSTMEDALAAANALGATEFASAIMDAIEPDSVRMLHLRQAATFEPQ